jgi:hypothetical protein
MFQATSKAAHMAIEWQYNRQCSDIDGKSTKTCAVRPGTGAIGL